MAEERRENHKRRLTTPTAAPDPPESTESLLETLLRSLSTTDRFSVDLAIEKIVDARASEAERGQAAESAVALGTLLVEAGLRSRRKVASRHNARSWPLPPDLTVKVFSLLDTRSQCYVAASCSLFNKLTCESACYANIDLTSISPRINNTVVSTMIQRAEKNLRSLKLGSRVSPVEASVPSWNDKMSRLGKKSSGLTRSCLLVLSMNGGVSGALLRSLHLYNIQKIDDNALCTALCSCTSLLDIELIGLYVELRQTLESISTNCHLLLRLYLESSKTGKDNSLRSPTCRNLVNGCPAITTLALRGFKLSDRKIDILVKGFNKLKSVDFSTSYAVTGNFLSNLGGTNSLEVLLLRDCVHLKEVEVTLLLVACLSGCWKSLRYLDISNRDCLGSEREWWHRLVPRANLLLKISLKRSFSISHHRCHLTLCPVMTVIEIVTVELKTRMSTTMVLFQLLKTMIFFQLMKTMVLLQLMEKAQMSLTLGTSMGEGETSRVSGTHHRS